jgi:hypothetical protein
MCICFFYDFDGVGNLKIATGTKFFQEIDDILTQVNVNINRETFY